MKSRLPPQWIQPNNSIDLPKLKLYNSLTNSKDLFIPSVGRRVEWYSCGPTVYDVSHMGHARTYISIDILRRVLQNYFKYDIHFVMNITDIDDKIIKRARQNYLFEKYLDEEKNLTEVKDYIKKVLEHLNKKITEETDDDKKQMYENDKKNVENALVKESITESDVINLKDSISDLLDIEKGETVTDNKIFVALPKHFEEEYHSDMKKLNILPPDDLTRVSEYVDKIVDYVAKIMSEGYAYESNGSVYFDTAKFDGNEKFYYAKLVPNAYGNENLLKEGEGVLMTSMKSEKRNDTDFALWKASKSGEPSWPSPWGLGRPGWHIECSAMASDKCGPTLDIHTGGSDLKFPHHDNEIAQAEAYHDSCQWVNYFLHTGHLTISGCKMSKSLKNFISIRQALEQHSWRQLRFAFLLHSWKDVLDYGDETMTSACNYEKMFLNFFYLVENVMRIHKKLGITEGHGDTNTDELEDKLKETKSKIHESLCDSVNTQGCLFAMKDLIEIAIGHITQKKIKGSNALQLRNIAKYIYELLLMFGAAEVQTQLEFGLINYTPENLEQIQKNVQCVMKKFVEKLRLTISNEEETIQSTIEQVIGKYFNCSNGAEMENWLSSLERVADFRQAVRSHAIDGKWKKLLALCDELRDVELAEIGVLLQDNEDNFPSIGLIPTWAIEKRSGKKQKEQKQKAEKSVSNTKEKIDKTVDPAIMFTVGRYAGKYSKFDDAGVPTHDNDGVEISNSQRKKLTKEQRIQREAFNKHNSTAV